ncbi:MAG: hypothetical protein GKC53_05375 [Neisseriaceae bacterium]|nr:MAG: hypothetical protein GKC53_05375 [Neisseriaceae bacterium]
MTNEGNSVKKSINSKIEQNSASALSEKHSKKSGDGVNGGSGFLSPGASGSDDGCDGGSSFYSPGKSCKSI